MSLVLLDGHAEDHLQLFVLLQLVHSALFCERFFGCEHGVVGDVQVLGGVQQRVGDVAARKQVHRGAARGLRENLLAAADALGLEGDVGAEVDASELEQVIREVFKCELGIDEGVLKGVRASYCLFLI